MPSNHIYNRTGLSLVAHNIPDRAYPSEFQAAGVLPKDGLYPTVGLPGSRARFFCWGNEELRIADLQGGATAEKLHHRYLASTEKCHGNHRSFIHPLDVLKSCTDKSGYPVVTESTGIDLIASSKATCSRSRIPPIIMHNASCTIPDNFAITRNSNFNTTADTRWLLTNNTIRQPKDTLQLIG